MKLHYFPLSTYSQKVLTAFYEKNVPFTPEIVSLGTPEGRAEYRRINPYGKVPALVLDDGSKVIESTTIVEYLDDHFASVPLVPVDKHRARQARFHDRCFDLYMNEPMSTMFFDGRKLEAERNPVAVAAAKAMLDTTYALYDEHFAGRTWAVGDEFTLADCSAAPALTYCRTVYPTDAYKNLTSYANRLAERASFVRVVAEAAPYFAALARR